MQVFGATAEGPIRRGREEEKENGKPIRGLSARFSGDFLSVTIPFGGLVDLGFFCGEKYSDFGSAQEKYHPSPNIYGGAKTAAAV